MSTKHLFFELLIFHPLNNFLVVPEIFFSLLTISKIVALSFKSFLPTNESTFKRRKQIQKLNRYNQNKI